MWDEASQVVKSIFYTDEVEIYELGFTENSIGEDIEQLILVGNYPCNVQNGESGNNHTTSGESTPQTIRISASKGIPLAYDKTYKLRIKKAKISFDPNEVWKVVGWTEAQISTVISASREVVV